MTVVMALGSRSGESRVFIGETDISESAQRVEVIAEAGKPTRVTITLIAAVEIIGQAKVEFKGNG